MSSSLKKEFISVSIAPHAIAFTQIPLGASSFASAFVRELTAPFEEIPAGRMGRPDEAGKLAVMLADAPSYLTGQIITLDGAWI